MKLLTKIYAALWLVSFSAYSQTDVQNWYGSSLTLNLKKKWEVSGQYRLRIIDNISTYRGSYFYLQTDKKFSKHFSMFTSYRLALVDNGNFHRFAVGASAQTKFKDFALEFRPMIQYQSQQFKGDDEQKEGVSSYLRPRGRIKYSPSKKWDLYMYSEPFVGLHNAKLDWWQNSIGLKYAITKKIKINPYYIWQPDYSKRNFRTNHIIGFDLEFEVKP
ncbi:MAG: DUF2490 domain-containing protein [Spirosomataceae bacterium]